MQRRPPPTHASSCRGSVRQNPSCLPDGWLTGVISTKCITTTILSLKRPSGTNQQCLPPAHLHLRLHLRLRLRQRQLLLLLLLLPEAMALTLLLQLLRLLRLLVVGMGTPWKAMWRSLLAS